MRTLSMYEPQGPHWGGAGLHVAEPPISSEQAPSRAGAAFGGGGGGLGGGGLGDGGGGPTCCGFREHSLGSAAVARGVEPPSVRGSVVEHGVAVIFLVELGHGSWRREVLDSGAARQPEVLRAIVEALQRPSIAWLGLG